MRFHPEARRDRYDAIVVGSGMGGLTAAALLARAGRGVLVVERHDRVGGYAHAFRRGRRVFDSAVHVVGGGVATLLRELGVADRCELVPVDPLYRARYPGLTVRAPAGVDAFVDAHAELFPGEEKGLRELLEICRRVRAESEEAEALPSAGAMRRAADRFPALRRWRRATVADALEVHLADPRARAAVATLWPYLGLPPSRLSFLYFAAMLLSYVEDGALYCRGSFQRLAAALAAAVEIRGGEILLRSSVRRIVVEDGAVRGVILENGQRIASPCVVSNADGLQTVFELVGGEHFAPRTRSRLRALRRSLSAFVVYAAARIEPPACGLGHENFFYPGVDHDEAFAGALAARPLWWTATVPTLLDPGLAPAGEHLLMLTTLVAPEARRWPDAKPRLAEALLAAAARRIPGLREGLLFAEGATPRTLERYTRNADGAAYGWDVTPGQTGPSRPGPATDVAGLFLAGHWSRPGGGVAGAVASGRLAARAILEGERS